MFLTYVHAEIITYCAPVLICVFSTKLTSGKAHPSFNLFPFLFHQDIRRSEECGSCFPATGVDYVSRKPPTIRYFHLLSFNFVSILISPHTLLFTHAGHVQTLFFRPSQSSHLGSLSFFVKYIVYNFL